MKDITQEQDPERRIRRVRTSSIIIAVLTAAEWIWMGIATPRLKLEDFHPRSFDWPYPYTLFIHWKWAIPLAFILAVSIAMKDRLSSRKLQIILNVVFTILIVITMVLWGWGVVPHRMVQFVQ